MGLPLKGATAAVQGFGNAGTVRRKVPRARRAPGSWPSPTPPGGIHDKKGLDIDAVVAAKEKKGSVDRRPGRPDLERGAPRAARRHPRSRRARRSHHAQERGPDQGQDRRRGGQRPDDARRGRHPPPQGHRRHPRHPGQRRGRHGFVFRVGPGPLLVLLGARSGAHPAEAHDPPGLRGRRERGEASTTRTCARVRSCSPSAASRRRRGFAVSSRKENRVIAVIRVIR